MTDLRRTTIYLEPELYEALKLKAEATGRSVSALVNEAVRCSLAEDTIELAAFEERADEPEIDFEVSNSADLHLNLVELTSKFFRRLQHQLDVTKVLQVGCDSVTLEQIAVRRDFGSFVPAAGSKLSLDVAKEQAQDWLLLGFLRDAIESTGLFLDECLQVCGVMAVALKGAVSGAELHYLVHELPRKNHRLHLPIKLEKLEREFNVATRFNSNILSLNRARTCVVHRLGAVSDRDIDESGSLRISFQHVRFIARGDESGDELLIDKPGAVVTEDSVLELHFVETQRSFQLGEQIRLEAGELYDIILTLWRFGRAVVEKIEGYGRSIGLQVPGITNPEITRSGSGRRSSS